MVGAIACLLAIGAACSSSDGDGDVVAIYPIDGTQHADAETAISFRGAGPDELGEVVVTGSQTGVHDGEVVEHRDGDGATFRPDEPFEPGEQVTIEAGVELAGDDEIDLTIAVPGDPPDEPPTRGETELPDPELRDLVTVGGAAIPVATVDGDVGSGLFLSTPLAIGDGDGGAQIIDADGELVWWYPAPDDTVVGNLSTHELDGEPVLAWFEGTAPYGVGKYEGEWVVVDSSYQEVMRIGGANGMPLDIHDLEFTGDGTAVVVAYQPVVVDLTEHGGAADAVVFEAVVQELDPQTGDVHFEWHSLDEVPITDGRAADIADPFVDYTHINAADIGPDGRVVVSLRHTSQIMEVDRVTGDPIWILGGDSNNVDVGEDVGISYPHHVRWLSADRISVFDNGVEREDPTSRGVVYELGEIGDDGTTFEVVTTFAADPPRFTLTQGSIQIGDDGALAMWSNDGVATFFDPDGTVTGSIDLSTESYRMFFDDDWVGRPASSPSVVALDGALVASWNGATDVETWEVVVADEVLASAGSTGFETMIELPDDVTGEVEVRALDEDGDVIDGSSASATI